MSAWCYIEASITYKGKDAVCKEWLGEEDIAPFGGLTTTHNLPHGSERPVYYTIETTKNTTIVKFTGELRDRTPEYLPNVLYYFNSIVDDDVLTGTLKVHFDSNSPIKYEYFNGQFLRTSIEITKYTLDWWYPNYNDKEIKLLFFIHTEEEFPYRIACYGNDNFMLEKEFKNREEARLIFIYLSGLNFIQHSTVLKLGFEQI